jgi:hypothetical protein
MAIVALFMKLRGLRTVLVLLIGGVEGGHYGNPAIKALRGGPGSGFEALFNMLGVAGIEAARFPWRCSPVFEPPTGVGCNLWAHVSE